MLEIIKTLHSEFLDRIKSLTNMVERDVTCLEMPDKISVILGMRRVGKTYLMFSKIKQLLASGMPSSRMLYIDFEDDRLLPLNQEKLATLLDNFFSLYPENHEQECYIFLDEIQNIANWPLVIRRFQNTKQVRFYLSGSSAKLLSKEIATELRGRAITTEVFPFSFQEYLRVKNIAIPKSPLAKKTQDELTAELKNYLREGGLPGVVSRDIIQRTLVLQDYIDTVLFRDIVERYNITNLSVMKYIIHYLLSNFATNFSVNKFYNDLKSQGFNVSRTSMYDYLTYIEDAYLVFTVSLYSESVRKVQMNPKKIYTIDNGISQANLFSRLKNNGRFFENLVYLDLRRRGHEIYYYITPEGYEIDFLTKSLTGELSLYQVCYDQSDAQTYEREMRALSAAEDDLGIKGQIITMQNYLHWW